MSGGKHGAGKEPTGELLLEVRAEEGVARARLARRLAEDADASDAGPERLAASIREFEPIDPTTESDRRVVWTDRSGWRAELDAVARDLAASG